MYFPYFMTYILVGFAISLVVFFWALKTGQFSDQQRARFLPLEDENEPPSGQATRIQTIEIVALGILACTGLAASAAVLIFSLFFAG